jgi:hypothetical protein
VTARRIAVARTGAGFSDILLPGWLLLKGLSAGLADVERKRLMKGAVSLMTLSLWLRSSPDVPAYVSAYDRLQSTPTPQGSCP